jgi:hypothetical protein
MNNKEGKYSSIIDSLIKLSADNSIHWVDISSDCIKYTYTTINNDIKIVLDKYNLTIGNEVCPVSAYQKFNELLCTARTNASKTQLDKVSILFKKFKKGLQ